MTSQIKKVALSVPAIIAEGFGRFHFMDKAKSYINAGGSIYELKSYLLIAKKLGFISKSRRFFGIIGIIPFGIIPAGKFSGHYMSNPFNYGVVVSGNDFADRHGPNSWEI